MKTSSIYENIFNIWKHFQSVKHFQSMKTFSIYENIFNLWKHFRSLITFSINESIFNLWKHFQSMKTFSIYEMKIFSIYGNIFNLWKLFQSMKNFRSINIFNLWKIFNLWIFLQTKQNLRVKHMWRKRGIENHLEYLQVPAILQPLLAKDTETAELGAASTEIEISVSVIFPTRPSFFWPTLQLWRGKKKNTVKRKKKVLGKSYFVGKSA